MKPDVVHDTELAQWPKETVWQNLSFVLPIPIEEQLAALAVLREYAAVLNETEGVKNNVWIQGINPRLRFLTDSFKNFTIQTEVTAVPEPKPANWYGWDLRFYFDTTRAKEIARATGKHIVSAYGIMLGIEPSIFPAIPEINSVTYGGHTASISLGDDAEILIVDNFEHVEAIKELLETHMPERKTEILRNHTLEFACAKMQRAKLIIGQRSAETYLAAACFKPVVELYSADEPRTWLSKWTNSRYTMIYGDVIDIELIWRAIERTDWS